MQSAEMFVKCRFLDGLCDYNGTHHVWFSYSCSFHWHMTLYDKMPPPAPNTELKHFWGVTYMHYTNNNWLLSPNQFQSVAHITFLGWWVSPENMLQFLLSHLRPFYFHILSTKTGSVTWGRTYPMLKILNYLFDHLQCKHVPLEKK